jgi:Ca-activated chloride channel family protein
VILQVLLSIAFTSLAAQQAPPQSTFRSGVSTVEVYATVTDRTGQLMPDLTQDDFEIREDGKVQPLTIFQAGFQAITIAIMVDESPSLFAVAGRTRDAVSEFASRLRISDRAIVGTFSHIVRLDGRLTSNRRELVLRLDEPSPEFPAGTALWDGIDAAARTLERERGRCVILVLTDAVDNCSEIDPADVRTHIERAGIMVYGVGVKGADGLPARELSDLAKLSGGWYFELKPNDDIAATFGRVADELHRQYLLGFSPTKSDGKAHQIEVRVRARGAVVRARTSYTADPR